MKLQLSRRRFMAATLGLICLLFISGCAPEPKPISIALHVWPGYEPLPLAREMKWLDQNKVKIVDSTSLSQSAKLLEEGKVDAAGITLDEVLRIREKGIPLAVILVCDTSAGADMLLARSNIKALPDLKGKRIAVEDGALGALMLHQALQAAGLKAADIKPISLSSDKQAQAWRQEDIDAAITYEPASSQIKARGGKVLFDSSQMPNLVVDVIAVRYSVLDNAHAGSLQHLVSAHLQGLDHIHANPDDAAYRMAPRFNLPHDQVMSSFKGLVLPDLDNNLRLIEGTTPVLLTSARTIGKVLQDAGVLHNPADTTGFLHPEYLPRPNR